MLFFYFDLPTVTPASEDETDEDQTRYDYSGFNGSVESNSFEKKRLPDDSRNIQTTEESPEYVVSNDMISDLSTSNGAVVDGEKQRLINVNKPAFRKRSRTGSVMDKWHLAKGRLGYQCNSCVI